MAALAWVVLLAPLAAAILLGLPRREPSRAFTRILGVGPLVAGFVLTVVIWVQMLGRDAEDRAELSRLWEWIEIGDLRVNLEILVDPLSALMVLVITGVGSLIFIYSTEYMNEERDYRRFFAEMNFFAFSMLLLVLAANFLFLIVGWALVGLASYLLIGYHYDRPVAVAAARKAFVINVIGDVGMVIAAIILVVQLGTLDYAGVFAGAAEGLGAGTGAAEAVALLLFVGAAAKSAQVPLHTWLPDAMEGPTPVSALIHAATMVTAGVYLIARANPLYEIAPIAADTVAVVGAVTLLLAATIAIVQEDIKRVLAWSTISQIGYMIMAAGLGAYASAMFHFLTHAFFKALLFLAAGIVIHALAGEQSLDRMGALARRMPLAFALTLVGVIAIAGVPGTSGFFSKDEILAHAWDEGALGKTLWVVGTIAAGLTAFYMFRLLFRAFLGAPGAEHQHLHLPGLAMLAPVVVLAGLALVGGWIQVPGGWQLLEDFLEPSLAGAEPVEISHGAEILTLVATIVVVGIGLTAAWWVFLADPERRLRLSARLAGPRRVLEDGYRFDAVITQAVVEPTKDLGGYLLRAPERGLVQGLIAGPVAAARGAALGLSAGQSGLVRSYVFVMLVGVALVGIVLVLGVTDQPVLPETVRDAISGVFS